LVAAEICVTTSRHFPAVIEHPLNPVDLARDAVEPLTQVVDHFPG